MVLIPIQNTTCQDDFNYRHYIDIIVVIGTDDLLHKVPFVPRNIISILNDISLVHYYYEMDTFSQGAYIFKLKYDRCLGSYVLSSYDL